MQRMPDHQYEGSTIVVKVWPASSNRYQSSLSIHRKSPNSPSTQLALVYQEGRDNGLSCETAEDANQDALERARAWIDANPT